MMIKTNFKITMILFSQLILLACSNTQEPATDPDTGNASYKVTFTSTWSATTHPDSFPASPHFSGIIGATHNMNIDLWESGELATAGIETVAETGGKATLENEINALIDIGDTDQLISEGGINPSPGKISFNVTLKPDYSFISLVSMLAPSPDWIVGVNAINLMESGVWVESKTIDLYVYDAGTDDGDNYTATNLDANPKQIIARIETSPFLVGDTIKPIGTMVFEKQ